MTEVIAALCGVIGALVTALGVVSKRLRTNSQDSSNTNGGKISRNIFDTQVSLCNERFITLASNIGSINTSLTNIMERQTRIEDKIDRFLGGGKNPS